MTYPWVVTSLYINGGAAFSVLCGLFRDYVIDGLREEAETREWEYNGVQQRVQE
jgi:hypothetical protein